MQMVILGETTNTLTGTGISLMHFSLQYNLLLNFKECHLRCVDELDRWEGSQKHNSYFI